MPILRLFPVLILGLLLFAARAGSDRLALTHQHVDLRIHYSPGTTQQLYLLVYDADAATHHPTTNVVLVVRAAAETSIPPGFELFGEPGSPFWILPASQDPELLYLGVSAEGLPRGSFEEPLSVRLVRVEAPGWFFAWQFDAGGGLEMRMNSRDGIGPDDVIQPVVGSHAHLNWGFSRNGFYAITFQVEGRLAGASTNLPVAETTVLFAVEPLPDGPPSPAVLSAVAVTEGGLTATLAGQPGTLYQVQTSADLLEWKDAFLVTAEATAVPLSVPVPEEGDTLFLRARSFGSARPAWTVPKLRTAPFD